MKNLLSLMIILLISVNSNSHLYANIENFYFIENKGQFNFLEYDKNDKPLFLFLNNELQLLFYKTKITLIKNHPEYIKNEIIFNKKNANVELIGIKENKFYLNFYLPHCPNGIKKIKTFKSIQYQNLYDGLDLIFKIENDKILYEFNLHYQSGSSVESIPNNIIYQSEIIPILNYPRGEISINKQEIKKNKSYTSLQGFNYSWITYIGGLQNESLREITVDNDNNMIVCGFSFSDDYPITSEAFQKNNKGSSDIIISKFSKNNELIWSTYIGSSGQDVIWNIKTNSKNEIWLAGESWNKDFPITYDAYQPIYNGGTADCIIIKLSVDGKLLYSSYLGGSEYETFADLGIDTFDNIILTGRTFSDDFPIIGDAIKKYKNDGYDAIVVRFYDDGKLFYSSYLGGSSDDYGEGLAIDISNNIAISGYSASYNFPILGNSFQKINKGKLDAFIIKISPDNNILWSSLFGGSETDFGSNINCDNDNNFILSGYTQSNNLFTSNQSYQNINKGAMDAFIVKFSNNGDLIWSTYYGGNSNECLPGYDINDKGGGIAIDHHDNILICNQYTESSDLPMTDDAFQKQIGGKKDAYIAIFDKNGNLNWSSYLGGYQDDYGRGACFDNDDNIIAVGETFSNDFPVSQDAFQITKSGGSDGFIAKFFTTESKTCDGYYFEYPDFKNPTNINIIGHTDYYNRALRLNPAWKRQQGAAWHTKPVSVGLGFETEFQFKISEGNQGSCDPDGSLPGADGFAFVIQNNSPNALGYSDWGIGYEGIPNSLAIEFDTFKNIINQSKEINDPDGNHIAVQSMGTQPNTTAHSVPALLALNDSISEIDPFGTPYWVKINYTLEDSTLKIYLSKTRKYEAPVIILRNLLLNKLLSLQGDTAAYIGFTGSTGDAWENHDILYWSFCSKISSGCDLTAFNFPTKNSSNDFIYSDSAKPAIRDSTEYLKLTNAFLFQKGAVWYNKKVPVSRGFSTSFSFRITDGDNNKFEDGSIAGADGIALVIQNYKLMTGKAGSGIGYANIPNSIAIEFDTYYNNLPGDDIDDPNGNHIAVQSAGKNNNTAKHNSPSNLGINDKIIEIIPEGRIYYVKIEYDGISKEMKIYFDDTGVLQEIVLVIKELDLTKLLELDDGKYAYIGLTSATGNAVEIHEILTWEMCPYPLYYGTGIKENHPFDEIDNLRIYPQPAWEEMNIEYYGIVNEPIAIVLFNILGERVLLYNTINIQTGINTIKIKTSSLINGLYSLYVKTGKKIYCAKVIIE